MADKKGKDKTQRPVEAKETKDKPQGVMAFIQEHMNLMSSSMVLAYVTLLGYLLAYAKELAVFSRYGISTHFVEVSLEDILLNVLVVVILLGMYMGCREMRDGIVKKINKKVRRIIRIAMVMVLVIILLFALFCQFVLARYNQAMLFWVAVVVLMAVSTYEVTKPLLRGVMTAIGGIALTYIVGFIIGVCGVSLKSEHQIMVDEPRQIILSDYKEGYIVAPLTDELTIVPMYTYYEASHDTKFYTLRCKGSEIKVQEVTTYEELVEAYHQVGE